jgi:hypothetical protein
MTTASLRAALLWCSIINYALLILWSVLLRYPTGWIYQLSARWFRVSREQFDNVNFLGLVFYKVLVILFNIVPFLALCIIGG